MNLVTNILIATDYSDCSRRALDYGAAMAAKFGAKVVLLHVYSPPVIVVPEAVIPFSTTDLQAMLDKMQGGLDAAAATARQLGAEQIDTVLVQGDAWQEIVRVARERGCDLVIVGTHGRGAISHFILGSVAEKVVRKAPCPVLVVGKRPTDAEAR